MAARRCFLEQTGFFDVETVVIPITRSLCHGDIYIMSQSIFCHSLGHLFHTTNRFHNALDLYFLGLFATALRILLSFRRAFV